MTPEQEALMSMARESLQAAKLLADQAFYGFAVSRAYYVMFYVARALLLGEGLAFSKHSGTVGAFGKEFTKTGRVPVEFHRYLLDAQDERLAADYKTIGRHFMDVDATIQIERAEQFIALGERLLGTKLATDEE